MRTFSLPRLPGSLLLPAIVAPMFLVSGPRLVSATCKAGLIGSFPSANARTPEEFDGWLSEIEAELEGARKLQADAPIAPYAVNLIMHPTNQRRAPDLEIIVAHRVPLVITSVGNPTPAIKAVHAYGGQVFCDVASVRHAQRAVQAGVDGLILLCAGAGGHTGWLSPFAFLPEVRKIFDGPIVLAGGIANGRAIRAAQMLGADAVYMGTRFLAATESLAHVDYKTTLVASNADDIVLTSAVSGMPGNFLRSSLERFGLDPASDSPTSFSLPTKQGEAKRWRDIWSAGHAVGAVPAIQPVAEIVQQLAHEFAETLPE